MAFSKSINAYNYILVWDGENVRDLLDAVRQVQEDKSGSIFRTYLPTVLRDVTFRYPLPAGIPKEFNDPIWAVDRNGFALVGSFSNLRIEKLAFLAKSSALPTSRNRQNQSRSL